MPLLAVAACFVAQAGLLADPEPRPAVAAARVVWDRAAVEHLWNRAGFGVREDEIERWLELGPEALVETLLAGPAEPRTYDPGQPPHSRAEIERLPKKASQAARRAVRQWARRGVTDLRTWWAAELLDGEDPLGDRMTLFWQGVFTSGDDGVRDVRMLASQHALLRQHATGSYAELLRGILRDPAMLTYLNNDQNQKRRPNENLAREVMELFSLGVGHYSERDVREAARALTGHTVANARYRFLKGRHDFGVKEVLGVRGRLDAEDLAEVLLAQSACAEFVARSVIEYLEGIEPEPQRVERYAVLLRESEYELRPLLRELFLDPDFYRPEARQARVTSPVDYLVGITTRLGLAGDAAPPAEFVARSASILGQTLFRPPNVKGWDEGLAWITTSSFMQRGSLAGVLIGALDAELLRAERERLAAEIAAVADMDRSSMKEARRQADRRLGQDELVRAIRTLGRKAWEPRLALHAWFADSPHSSDDEAARLLLDSLLAIEAPTATCALIAEELRSSRASSGLSFADPRSEPELRRVAHLILSLPEAQLH